MYEIRKIAKLGVVHPMLFPQVQSGEGPICETAHIIVEDPFFECIEVSWVKNGDTRKSLARLLDMGHMEVVYTQGAVAYAKKLNLHSLDSKKRKESVKETKKLIDEARFFNACIFQLITGSDPGVTKREEAKKYLVDSLRELCEYAADLMVSVENLDREVHKKFLIGPTAEAIEVIREVKKDFHNIGLTMDLAHLPLLRETFQEAITTAKEHLVHVHLGNCILKDSTNPRHGDKHPPLGIKGGEIGIPQLAQFLRILMEVGFLSPHRKKRPVVSFEILPTPDEEPEIILAASKRILGLVFAQLDG